MFISTIPGQKGIFREKIPMPSIWSMASVNILKS